MHSVRVFHLSCLFQGFLLQSLLILKNSFFSLHLLSVAASSYLDEVSMLTLIHHFSLMVLNTQTVKVIQQFLSTLCSARSVDSCSAIGALWKVPIQSNPMNNVWACFVTSALYIEVKKKKLDYEWRLRRTYRRKFC